MRNSPTGLRKGAWTEEEDSLLRKCIEKYGEGKWHQVPYRAGLNRCRKSCRLRWLNYLRPNIKRGNFGLDEVDLIIRLHRLLGNRWSLIAGRLPGRTANDVKNYWNTHIKKKQIDVGARESGSRPSKIEAPKATARTIFKPQPRTFSKNAPWLRQNAEINTRTDNQNLGGTGSSVPKSLSTPDHDMQWLENLINENEMNENPSWPFGDFGDERVASLWSEEIWSGAKETDNCVQDGQNDFGVFCINADL